MPEWITHNSKSMPVHPETIVVVVMENGDELPPMKAKDIDWDCPGDDGLKYKVVS